MQNKKYVFYYCMLVIICFSIPFAFTIPFSKRTITVQENIIENVEKTEIYDYKQYSTIKLLHTKTNEVEELPLDKYICGVVCAEMPASFEEEALKAQAIVARTYTLYKIMNNKKVHNNADICDSPKCCQAWFSKEDRMAKWKDNEREMYWNKIENAVETTKGKIITYEGKPINAFFHSNSGGNTEPPINVWGGSGYPYLKSVETAGEDGYSQYASKVEVSKNEFEQIIKKVHSDFQINFEESDCIKVEEYTEGKRVKSIKVGNLRLSGVEMRNLFKLKSANFKISIENDKIKFDVIGYGHGVGMSQTGADSLAKQGKNCDEIIHHFYTDVEIKNI